MLSSDDEHERPLILKTLLYPMRELHDLTLSYDDDVIPGSPTKLKLLFEKQSKRL